jgi:hypothetical protein
VRIAVQQRDRPGAERAFDLIAAVDEHDRAAGDQIGVRARESPERHTKQPADEFRVRVSVVRGHPGEVCGEARALPAMRVESGERGDDRLGLVERRRLADIGEPAPARREILEHEHETSKARIRGGRVNAGRLDRKARPDLPIEPHFVESERHHVHERARRRRAGRELDEHRSRSSVAFQPEARPLGRAHRRVDPFDRIDAGAEDAAQPGRGHGSQIPRDARARRQPVARQAQQLGRDADRNGRHRTGPYPAAADQTGDRRRAAWPALSRRPRAASPQAR